MPTPDLSPYSDLVLYDAAPSDLVARALLAAQTTMPEWTPQDTNTELALLETLALIAAEQIYAINRVPAAVVMTLLGLYGINRDPGTPPTATATFTAADTTGHDIPAGTVVRLVVNGTPIDFTTDDAATIPGGSATVTGVDITGTQPTALANGVTAGTALQLISTVGFLNSAVLATAVAAGADPEADADYLDRALQRFTRLNDTLVTAPHFLAEALTFAQVYRATAIDNYDGAGTAAGHVTVAVLGSAGALVSSGDKTAIAADLASKAQANLAVHVIDPTITDVDVTAAAKALPGWSTSTVHDNIVAALTAYLSTDSWPWAATVRVNELIALIDQVDGVDYVVSVTVPGSDVSLTGIAPLARLDTVSVTVT